VRNTTSSEQNTRESNARQMSKPKAAPPAPHLITLGGSALVRVSGGEPLLAAGKPLALLCYLAFSPRRAASREHLVDLLWSDAEPDRARHVLRQTLWYIRQATGDDIVSARDGELSLRGDVTADRDEFLRAVDQGDLDRALALYPGDFLPGLSVPGGAAFDQWADVERYRLRAAFLRAGEALIRRHLGTGHARDALPLARRLRDAAPLSEQTWRLLLEAHSAAGDPVGAGMEADALERLLTTEGREPEPATRALIRVARRTPAEAPGGERGLTAELVGRERQFSQIVRAWEEAGRGHGRHVHVVSPAGFGKTRLLGEIQARLRAAGARVVALRAVPGERHLTGGLIAELAHALAPLPGGAAVSPSAAGTLVALHPAVSSFYNAPADLTTGEDALRRRTAALIELVAAVADEGPLAVILDDLHWADTQSRAVISGLSGRLGKEPVLLVTSARTGTPADPATAEALRLTLEPLTTQQVEALLASVARLPDDPWVESAVPLIHQAASGCPLLVLETLQLALERNLLSLTDGRWECGEPEALKRQLRSGSALRHRVAALDRTSAWLLLVLAVAGTPLSLDQLAWVTRRPPADLEPVLAQLELRGLVTRVADDWAPGHDEIGALAIEIAPPGAVKAADKELGLLWLTDAERDPGLLARAGPHLAAAEEWTGLERAYAAWVRRARRRGDRGNPRELAIEILGERSEASLTGRLVRSLPPYLRLGVDSPGRAAAAAMFVVAIAAGAAALGRRPPPPDIELAVFAGGDADSSRLQTATLRRAVWSDLREVTPGSSHPFPAALNEVPAPRPGRDEWAYSTAVPDSGTIDIFLLTPQGVRRRLTFARGDDGSPIWSPDGEMMAFSSARWSPRSHYNLGLLDPDTRVVRRLTRTDATDGAGQWSPDGSRIAFARRYWTDRPVGLCWVTPDGTRLHCGGTRDRIGPSNIVGWTDPRHLLVLDGTELGPLILFDWDRDSGEVIEPSVAKAALSPDGKWLATLEPVRGKSAFQWMVRPMDAPDQKRPLVLGADPAGYRVVWREPPGPGRWIEHLDATLPGDTARLGIPAHVDVEGRDPRGRPVDAPVLEYASRDTLVATIDSTGLLTPRRRGLVTIVVSAGGWRVDSLRVPVRAAWSRTEIDEDWSDSLARFRAFGDPSPLVLRLPAGPRVFWTHGDSSFPSGLLSRQTFDAREGLGLEVAISVPTSLGQWQSLALDLTSGVDTVGVAQWDFRTGALPFLPDAPQRSCGVGLPAREGTLAHERIGALSGGNTRELSRPDLLNGTWHRLRVQIFPDGRCGLAIDGKEVDVGPEAIPLSDPFRLVLQGQSVRTRVLVGHLTVWRGVRTDVDWSRAP